jgi:hypothetical protein
MYTIISTYHHSILWRFFCRLWSLLITVETESDSVSSITVLRIWYSVLFTLLNVHYYIHLSPFNSVEVFLLVVLTVKCKSDSVSSITILQACHPVIYALLNAFYHTHLSPFNSEEVFCVVLLTVECKSDSVGSITILQACHPVIYALLNAFYHMHLSPFNSEEFYGAHFYVSINACTKLGPHLGSHNLNSQSGCPNAMLML